MELDVVKWRQCLDCFFEFGFNEEDSENGSLLKNDDDSDFCHEHDLDERNLDDSYLNDPDDPDDPDDHDRQTDYY
jgi:hypothetical protein